MSSKESILIKACVLILILLSLSSIVWNIISKDVTQSEYYTPRKTFSMVVSEDKWDESMMPKGKRSPKGVLYNPEK